MMNDREILRRTSRTFYLTIRLLPRAVRDDVALAYLLARATDTIADTSTAAEARRVEILRAARASLGHSAIAGYHADDWMRQQRDPAEQQLLSELPALWQRMHALPDRRIQAVLDKILEGQIFDLERFGPEALPLDDAELERYTYLVAGSVGEFWTDLCAAQLGNFARDPIDTMRQRARHYGQALQLVNILRDRRMDAALGRLYITVEDAPRWTEQARVWLGEGAEYCAALHSGRQRYATLLPALLGWRTLALSSKQSTSFLTPVKVPRAEVKRWMRRALPVWWSAGAVARVAHRAAD
jgi:farnesyl-diphosphate farnesyltransferase